MKIARAIAWAGICAWLVLILFAAMGQINRMPLEPVVAIVGVSSVFITMVVAARRAYRAGQTGWMLASIFMWPVSFYYVLALRHEAHEA